VRSMNPHAGCYILSLDRWANAMGRIVRLVLERRRGDHVLVALDPQKWLPICRADPPDAIFMYLWAGEPDALAFCAQIRVWPQTRHVPVIVWGALDPARICPDLRQAGASGYLFQPCTPDEIVAARDAALVGGTYFPYGAMTSGLDGQGHPRQINYGVTGAAKLKSQLQRL
jgi:DNA-binding NarL/FixJ family response regulator